VALVDLRDALTRAAELLGPELGDAVLDRIFATFCVGK
jgi:tRNA U34 5-carboxymethylaminomethyl modifying GTPase MnmE/TrmE